jgi:hypothetical protein
MVVSCDLCCRESNNFFEIRIARKRYVFDSFQCAIQLLAPVCAHCGKRIVGHGVEVHALTFCCTSCGAQSKSDAITKPDATGSQPSTKRAPQSFQQ